MFILLRDNVIKTLGEPVYISYYSITISTSDTSRATYFLSERATKCPAAK